MNNKKIYIFLTALMCFFLITCDNPILKKWWVDDEPEDYYYVPIMKLVPEVYYEEIIQQEIVYETIIKEVTVYEKIVEQLPPEVIYETIYVELPPEVITEIIYETIYQDKIVEVEKLVEIEKIVTVTLPPEIIEKPIDKDAIILWLENDASPEDIQEIIRVIKKYLTIEDIKEIIQETDPKELIKYLTDEQIKYILTQQSPEKFLQSLTVINIEYIIFAGDSEKFNGASPTGGTPLTAELIKTNNTIMTSTANILHDNYDKNYLVLLHGHANPVKNTPEELLELQQLSLTRANSVKDKLKTELGLLGITNSTTPSLDDYMNDRVSTEGYGGEGNIAQSSTSYAELNRRVEVIIIKIDTSKIN